MSEGELVREQILTDDSEAESESGEEDLILPATQFGLKQLGLKLMLEQRKYEQLAHQERPPTNDRPK